VVIGFVIFTAVIYCSNLFKLYGGKADGIGSATLVSITPLLILYGFVQKRFIQGIKNTGITGE
jgi:ABC-type glycerol-3-phosphate transport system permease component